MQQIRENKWDTVRDQSKISMHIETIASMSHRVSIVPHIVGAKNFFIFINYEVPPKFFEKIYIVTFNLSMI